MAAGSTKKKGKLWYEKSIVIFSKGAEVSTSVKATSDWNSGKGKTKPLSRRARKSSTDHSAIIVTCGGEFRGHLKADGVDKDGLKVMKVRQCVSLVQDAMYGKNKRVANLAEAKGTAKGRYRCTVCLNNTHTRQN